MVSIVFDRFLVVVTRETYERLIYERGRLTLKALARNPHVADSLDGVVLEEDWKTRLIEIPKELRTKIKETYLYMEEV